MDDGQEEDGGRGRGRGRGGRGGRGGRRVLVSISYVVVTIASRVHTSMLCFLVSIEKDVNERAQELDETNR